MPQMETPEKPIFWKIRFRLSRRKRRYFSAAKHGMEYVDFLKTR